MLHEKVEKIAFLPKVRDDVFPCTRESVERGGARSWQEQLVVISKEKQEGIRRGTKDHVVKVDCCAHLNSNPNLSGRNKKCRVRGLDQTWGRVVSLLILGTNFCRGCVF